MEEMPRDFKGVWIPKVVYLDSHLSALDKIIFAEISSLDCDKGCFASNSYLARFCQCSESKITKSISHLVDLGYLVVERFDGRKRFLRAWPFKNDMLAEIASEHSKKCQAQSQKILHSNINNNIVNKERKKEKTFDDIFAEKGISEKLKSAFVEFIKSRKLNGKKMTNRALELAIDKVRRMARFEEEQIAIINQSIENGWQGLFPLKERPLELPELGDEYEPKDGEDMTWRRILDFWEEVMEYRPGESKDNVLAIKKLLALDGEDGVKNLIASLRMRSEYKYLSSAIKNVSSPQDLLEHRQDIWSFYNKNKNEWQLWSEKAKEGKDRWEL